jgi:hypothetical protein
LHRAEVRRVVVRRDLSNDPFLFAWTYSTGRPICGTARASARSTPPGCRWGGRGRI